MTSSTWRRGGRADSGLSGPFLFSAEARIDFTGLYLTFNREAGELQAQRSVIITEQRQKLNPRMLQTLRIFTLPLTDLAEEIRTELEANPALEVVDDMSELSLESYEEAKNGSESEEWADENADFGYSSGASDEDTKRKFMEGAIALPETLQEHLLDQFRMLPFDAVQRGIGERLIQNLDGNGFHIIPPGELCSSWPESLWMPVMEAIRKLDPAGTCVSGYVESLLAQARSDPSAPPDSIAILENHMDSLEKGKYAEIRRALKITENRLQGAVAFIKSLSPFPGRAFSTEAARYVVPDLAIRVEDNEFVIELNDEIIPVLGINPFFSALSAKTSEAKDTAVFVKKNIEKAQFFIGSIHRRNDTLVKVARAIAKFQAPFFLEGPKSMRPLTLKQVAEEIDVHETTVSRVVSGKYVQTDWGILELKRFFTNAVPGSGSGEARHSKESAKQIIREILEMESEGEKALSDREIVDILAQRGVKIARRTVAKYRGELELDSSFSRRKH